MKNPHRRLFLGRSLGAAQIAAAAVLVPGAGRALAAAPAAALDARQLAFNHLLAGVRLSLGPWQLNMNFADELASFKAAANHVL